ncbi:MAG: hypothetical protein WCO35_00390 [Candidatus Nomurabacteria bacterium]
MKKLGEGYYYNVYEIENSKVIKKVKSKIRMYIFILISNYFNLKNAKKEYNSALENLKSLSEKYKNILNSIKDKSILGNPEFIDDLNYYQDKIKVIKKINKFSDQEFEKTCLDFAKLIHILWSYKLSDSTFKLRNNYGYDKNGNLIIIDFDEIIFKKEEVKGQIENKFWLTRYFYKILSENKKEIFKRIMDAEINLENLNKYWID